MSIADKLKTVAQKMEDVYRTGLFKYAPKLTASGDTILLENSAPEPFVDMIAYGHSWQNTTEGHQLGDFSRFQSTSMGGATLTNNGDGSLTISGNGTLTSSFNEQVDYTHEETISLIRSGRLYALIETLVVPYLYLYLIYDNGNKKAELYCLSGTHEHTDITEEMLDDSCYLRIGFYGSTGDEIKSGTIKPMLYQDGDGTYEPYTHGASPNPYFPQPIESATEVKVLGKNLFDVEKASVESNWIRATHNGYNGFVVQAKPNTEYTMSANQVYEFSGMYLLIDKYTNYFDGYGNIIANEVVGGRWLCGGSDFLGSATLTTDNTGKILVLFAYTTEFTLDFLTNIQIELGADATDYEPYTEQTLTLPTLHEGDVVDYSTKKIVRNSTFKNLSELYWKQGNANNNGDGMTFYAEPSEFGTLAYLSTHFRVVYETESGWESLNVGECLTKDGYIVACTSHSSLDEFKSWLSAENVQALIKLAEPIEEDLTDDQIYAFKRLRANSPTTTIIGQGQVDVTYIVDNRQ